MILVNQQNYSIVANIDVKKITKYCSSEKKAKKLVTYINKYIQDQVSQLNASSKIKNTENNNVGNLETSLKSLTRSPEYYMVRTAIIKSNKCSMSGIQALFCMGYRTCKQILEELVEDGFIILNPDYNPQAPLKERVTKYVLANTISSLRNMYLLEYKQHEIIEKAKQ